MQIYLVKYKADPTHIYTIGAFQDPDFAESFIAELIEAGDSINQIMLEFNSAFTDTDEPYGTGDQEEEVWMKEYQPRINIINEKIYNILQKHASQDSKIIVTDIQTGNGNVMDWFNSSMGRYFYIDEIEVAVPNLSESLEKRWQRNARILND